jgi:UDP-glucuronate decarboxylase
MRVMVTGGAGFLGSTLCEKLLKMENEVICLDNFSSGSKENLVEYINDTNFTLFGHDITEPIENIRVDQIYHLACPAAPGQYRKDPVKTIKINILGTINTLELARKNNAKYFHTSTIRIYDEINHLDSDGCYIEGKKFSETIVSDYKRLYNLDVRIGRLFTSYGPKMSVNDSRVVPQFIMKALRNEDLIVYGNGSLIDSFCYSTDTIESIIATMKSEYIHPINIGRGKLISIFELAELIIKISKSKSKIIKKNIEVANTSCDLIVSDEMWKSSVSLEEGIQNTIKYFEQKLRTK